MDQEVKLDPIDRRILRRLADDGRISWRDLAEAVGLSLTPTLRRVRQLEERGIIAGYSARLDEDVLMGGMVAFVSVTLERQTSEAIGAFEQQVSNMPEVMSGHQMSGGADFLLRVVVRGLEHYRTFLERLTGIGGVAHVQSSFALKSFVNRTAPMIPDLPTRRR